MPTDRNSSYKPSLAPKPRRNLKAKTLKAGNSDNGKTTSHSTMVKSGTLNTNAREI
ncbi:hypothetical protein F511_26339 [Dorcoceras hygrometricum]|uniref:Uncharacterized protein n=1 Tax=Dorcoceras hygrometricum TaxID=472368 RepID=A0A2Z7AGY8_9LAMI|nr:hypothetical protein F511_26339 [Dorcoceras hygrometricum]